jgi:hypothetical protein
MFKGLVQVWFFLYISLDHHALKNVALREVNGYANRGRTVAERVLQAVNFATELTSFFNAAVMFAVFRDQKGIASTSLIRSKSMGKGRIWAISALTKSLNALSKLDRRLEA